MSYDQYADGRQELIFHSLAGVQSQFLEVWSSRPALESSRLLIKMQIPGPTLYLLP